METLEFDGVFRFTNPTKEEFVFLWNNKEYVFPSMTTCPMIIANETLENIQEIRKKAAYKLSVREFYKGKLYTKMKNMGKGLPPTFDEKILEPFIEQCLTPLPVAKAKVREGKRENDKNYKSSKAMTDKDNPNFVFREEADNVQPVGKMPDVVTP